MARPRTMAWAVSWSCGRRVAGCCGLVRLWCMPAPHAALAGDGHARRGYRKRRALSTTHPDAWHVAHHRQWWVDSLRIDATKYPHALVGLRMGNRSPCGSGPLGVPQQGAQRRLHRLGAGGSRPVSVHQSFSYGQDAACGGGQSGSGDVYGDRCRSRLSRCLCARHRPHGHRGRLSRHLLSVSALHGTRVRDHHVRRGRARRIRQHCRCILGRPHHRSGAAALDAGPAGTVAERRDLCRLPADCFRASRGFVRTECGARVAMERTIGRDVRIIVLVAIVYLAASMLIENQYYQLMLTLVPVWAMLGIAWNVFSGYSGMVSFGHASFFGLGAYTVTLLLVKLDVSPWCGIPIGMVVGGIAGALIGWPTFRLRGHYFALAMLAYPLAPLYIFEWLGFQEVSLPMKRATPAAFMQFQDYRWYVAIALVMLVIAMAISLKIERSRFGLALLAIKQNEPAAEAAGINTRTWKIRALMVSGAIAAGIGGFYAVVLLIVTPPSVFGMLTSAQALIVTLFGGVATVWGPVVGSAILIPLAEVLQAELGDKIPGIQGVVFGVAIVLVILLAPEGIVPHLREALRRRRAEGTAGSAASTVLAAVHQPPAMTEHAKRTVSEEVVLKVEGLCRAFGGLKAVEDVSFNVRKGEVLGIIGPNGAGKTTLFNLLNGFLPPNAGQVIWANENLVGMRPNEICRRGIGRTFQVVRPFQRMTVLQNVVVGAFVAESDDEKALALAGEALARVGMADRAGALAGGLTHVELRLMELARALASRPQLLLLDETLAGLGSQEVERMLTVIDGLARGGATIVIIEHTMQAMVRLADRFVVLDHGRMLAQGKPEEVTKHPSVIEAYLGKRWMRHAQH